MAVSNQVFTFLVSAIRREACSLFEASPALGHVLGSLLRKSSRETVDFPADRFGNRADRMAHSLGQTNLFSFVIRQMRIASHGNTP